jgi:glutaredoxin-like YruB-family protein
MKIKVYSTPWCPFCSKVKEFLKEHGFDYEDVNVQENISAANEMIVKTGQEGVPVIEIGDKIIIGFDEPALREALGIKR